ncbi:MAG: recombinase family protein [Deltaproteobacteria bacterium]|nr:recombinase family protein [Deltaproteobacteria bacterium]
MEKLRFACLCRVSTEAQCKRGESLSTQKKQLEYAVKALGGECIFYSGQEHATPENERLILEALMRDAKEKKFDAVMVADMSRWSRDNGKSKEYLAVLNKHGIKFFIGQREFNLNDPTQSFMLGIGVEVAEFFAKEQAYKSIINRIERAKKGFPSCGKMPFGRKFDKATGKWSVVQEAQAKIKKIANTYLGEDIGFGELGRRFKMNGPNLHKILLKRCGNTWEQRFRNKSLKIDETVVIEIPPLLDDIIIKKIEAKSKARKTYEHGCYKHQYLFSRMIFDKNTGYALTGTPNKWDTRYYKPYQGATPYRYMVNAELLEKAVTTCLFDVLGSSNKLQKAVFDDINPEQTRENLMSKKQKYETDLRSIDRKIENAVQRLIDTNITVVQNKLKEALTELDEARSRALSDLEQTNVALSRLATPKEAEALRKKWSGLADRIKENYIAAGLAFHDLPYGAQRKLVQLIFGGVDATGKKYGIYIRLKTGTPRRYYFEAYGKLGVIYGQIESGEASFDDAVFIKSMTEPDRGIMRFAANAIVENDPALANKEEKLHLRDQRDAHNGVRVHQR